MKQFLVFGLCFAVVLAVPYREQEQQQNRYDQQQQRSDQQQRYGQQLRYDQQRHGQQQRYDQQQEHYDPQQRYDQQQQRYDQQQQRYDQQQQLDQEQDQYDRDDDVPLRYASYGPLSTSVDLLAKELNDLSSKYGGQGVLKVSYSPPSQRADSSPVHDLGHLNLKYFSPYAYRALSDQVSLLYAKNKKDHQNKYSSLNLQNINRVNRLEGQHPSLHDSILHHRYESRPSNYKNAYELSRLLNLRQNGDDDDDDDDYVQKN